LHLRKSNPQGNALYMPEKRRRRKPEMKANGVRASELMANVIAYIQKYFTEELRIDALMIWQRSRPGRRASLTELQTVGQHHTSGIWRGRQLLESLIFASMAF
jgi:hypothetical protein